MPNHIIFPVGRNTDLSEKGEPTIVVSELFTNTIQGEGVSSGVPAVFLRLTNCTLNCVWCDTTEVWRFGTKVGISSLLSFMEGGGVIDYLYKGAHLVLTGGSPMLQQKKLILFREKFSTKFNFTPYFEIENECVIPPDHDFDFIDQWNNSPKLSNSGMKLSSRYRPEVIKKTAELRNSWFKFVISCEEDIEEIKQNFIKPKLISESQVILMPCGQTLSELSAVRESVVEFSVREGWRFSDRLHVTIWDKKTGV